MKTKLSFLILSLIFIIISCTGPTDEEYINSIDTYRAEINDEFADTTHSPLTSEGLVHFEGLDFYPADPDYVIKARFVLNPDPEPFEMETTTARRSIYVKYGEAHFTFQGEDIILEIYQSD